MEGKILNSEPISVALKGLVDSAAELRRNGELIESKVIQAIQTSEHTAKKREAELVKQLTVLQNRYGALETALETLQQRLVDSKSAHVQEARKKDQELAKTDETIRALREANQKERQESEMLRGRVQQLDLTVSCYEKREKESNLMISRIQKELADAKSETQDQRKFYQSRLTHEVQAARQGVEEQRNELQRLLLVESQSKLQLEKLSQSLEAREKLVLALQADHQKLQKYALQARQQHEANFKAFTLRLNGFRATTEDLKRALQESEGHRQRLQQELVSSQELFQDQVARLRLQISQEQKKSEELSYEKARGTQELQAQFEAALERRSQDQSRRNREHEVELTAERERTAALETEIQSLKESTGLQLRELQEANRKAEEKVRFLEARITLIKRAGTSKAEEFKTKIQADQGKRQDFSALRSWLGQEISRRDDELEDLQAQLSEELSELQKRNPPGLET